MDEGHPRALAPLAALGPPLSGSVQLAASLGRDNGGIQAAVLGLSRGLASRGWGVELWAGGIGAEAGGLARRPFGALPLGLGSALAHSPAALLHQHGLWGWPSLASRRWPRSKPRVVSPHGMLEPWALEQSAWKKRLAWKAWEREQLQGASCLHALTADEAASLRRLGLKAPIAVIPNGVDLPPPGAAGPAKVLLFLGRMHPKKNLEALLEAWAGLGPAGRRDWKLRIAGWGDGAYVRRLESAAGAGVEWAGPAFGPAKDALFRGAGAFILPSFSEGLPLAVLEAWSYGLPVLMSRACGLPEGFTAGAARDCGTDAGGIAAALKALLAENPAELIEMGGRGRALVEREFTWDRVAERMHITYRWLLGAGPQPGWVLAGVA
jgi:glycosyltransferase involved in cell wall biosynthesis